MTLEELEKRLDAIASDAGERIIASALERAGMRATAAARTSLTRSGRQRTKHLRDSIRHEVRPAPGASAEMALMAGGSLGAAPVRYAAMQEYGGVIKPVRAKYLAVPTKHALTHAGVDRWGGPRGFPGELVFVLGKRGGKLLVDPVSGHALYTLRDSVRIKGRGYLRAGMREARKHVGKDILRGLSQHLARGRSGGA